jgi:hypothetical protein
MSARRLQDGEVKNLPCAGSSVPFHREADIH